MRVSKLVLMLSTLVFLVAITAVPAKADDYYISQYSCGCGGPMVLTHNHTGCAGPEQDLADMKEACLDCDPPIRLAAWRTVECEDYEYQGDYWSAVALKCPNDCLPD